jgi:hypothetical protein
LSKIVTYNNRTDYGCLTPLSINNISLVMVKLPDVCQYEGKKTSWDKTAIFLSVWRQKKKPTKEQS